MSMFIVYRDDLGYIQAEVEGSIMFNDGKVYFSVSEDEDHLIRVEDIVEIGQ